MCAVSFALGRWRGEHGRLGLVPLAPGICPFSYADGFVFGMDRRKLREERRTRVPARGGRR